MQQAGGFGALLRHHRSIVGLTQEQLAERAGLSRRGIADLERGARRAPYAHTIERLATALDLSPADRTVFFDAGHDSKTGPVAQAHEPVPAGLASLAPMTSFVGREQELGELRRVLADNRLVTLVGAGGVGKTRLALQLTGELQAVFHDGIWFANLAPLNEPALVSPAIARALGVSEQPGRPLLDTLAEVLDQRRELVVLDNCEHLVDACAAVAAHLLGACPHVNVLATSREPLRVAGEVVWQVPSLPVPGDDLESPSVDEVVRFPAMRLFAERARAARPEFLVRDSNVADVARICRRLDGLPLAIELAAAWVRVLSPREISMRLDHRFELLVDGHRTLPQRQQTLFAAVSWSYDLLSFQERRLFERLSVFSSSFELEAAEAVCSDGVALTDALPGPHILPDAALHLLSRLVDQSLVQVEHSAQQVPTRYRLPETLRIFGRDRLVAQGVLEGIHKRHADWLVGLAQKAGSAYQGPEQARWLRWAEREHDDVRAALEWALNSNDVETALELTAGLYWCWGMHLRFSEARDLLERVLTLPGAQARTSSRARLLVAWASMCLFVADIPAARALLDESLAICRDIGEEWVELEARGVRLLIWQFVGEVGVGDESEGLRTLAQRAGHTFVEVRMLEFLARVAANSGAYVEASARLTEAEQLARASGDHWSLARVLAVYGDVERSAGNHFRAARLYLESQALFAELGLADDPSLDHNLGYVALAAGEPARAAACFTRAVARFRRSGDRRGAAECVIGLAAVRAAAGHLRDAARLFGAGGAALEMLGSALYPANLRDYEHWVAVARAGLDSDTFGAAWAEGRALSLEQAVAHAADAATWIGQGRDTQQTYLGTTTRKHRH